MEELGRHNFVLDVDLDDEVTNVCEDLPVETIRKDRQHKLIVVLPPARSISPVTVQGWLLFLIMLRRTLRDTITARMKRSLESRMNLKYIVY